MRKTRWGGESSLEAADGSNAINAMMALVVMKVFMVGL